MEKPDIIRGIKSALDRGFSIEKIINSYLKAGYNKEDVIDSAKRVASDLGIELPTSIIAQKPVKLIFKSPLPTKNLMIKPRLQAPQQRAVQLPQRPIKLIPPKPIKPKAYFPEESQPESMQKIMKYAPPETKQIPEIPEKKLEQKPMKEEIRKEHAQMKTEIKKEELVKSIDGESKNVFLILLAICASLLFVFLILLLIFREGIVEFLNNLSA